MPAPSPIPRDPVRVALLTPPGRGALAVVGVAGAAACDVADGLFLPRRGPPLAARPDRAIAVGTWHALAGSPGEELVVVRHACDRLEVHCHGGTAAAAAVIESLVAAGAVRDPWPAWLAATGQTEIEREARQALAIAAGPRAARILCRQLAGALATEIDRLGSLAAPHDRQAAIARLLRAARVGLRLTEPWRVVVAGPVNAGKSSLVNALAGHARSIVSPEPGTTRDVVTSRIVLGGWEVELVDTAGDRAPDHAISATERAGIARATEARGRADLVLAAVPAGEAAPHPDPRVLVVVTKADTATTAPAAPPGAVITSSRTGLGIEALAARIVAALVPEDQAEPALLAGPVPFTPRQVTAIGAFRPAGGPEQR